MTEEYLIGPFFGLERRLAKGVAEKLNIALQEKE